MREDPIRGLYAERGLGAEAADAAVRAVRAFEDRLAVRGMELDAASLEELQGYLALLVERGENTKDRLLALARYFRMVRRDDLYIHFTSVLGNKDVFDSIRDRVAAVTDDATAARVFEGMAMLPLGAPPESWPTVTRRVLGRMQDFMSRGDCRKALAGNHHRIPVEGFAEDRKRFLSMGPDAYLADLHVRSVAEIRRHCDAGTVWFEQRITPRVVDFVESRPEILSGVLRDGRIFITKIPYDPDAYLGETDPLRKRWLACHCPLARSAILDGSPGVSREWCHCSAGYEKVRFEAAFGCAMEAEVLESALGGDGRCRFALTIPGEAARG